MLEIERDDDHNQMYIKMKDVNTLDDLERCCKLTFSELMRLGGSKSNQNSRGGLAPTDLSSKAIVKPPRMKNILPPPPPLKQKPRLHASSQGGLSNLNNLNSFQFGNEL